MKEIQLTQGKVALVDDADFELVAAHKWNAAKRKNSWYAQSYAGGDKRIHMHRLIMDFPEMEVDHINGNGLDNRRENLRLATRTQNNRNNRGHVAATSRFKGVSWSVERQKWFACIGVDGKTIPLGRYADEKEAAQAYNVAAKKLWGDFARLNDA